MDTIGQLNLQLGDLQAQKYQNQSQAFGSAVKGVHNVIDEYQKQKVESALAGDFNNIAKVAKEKGVPDSMITAMSGMWNSAQSRDDKLKILANIHSIIQAQGDKNEYADAAKNINVIANDNSLSYEEKQNKLLQYANNPSLLPLVNSASKIIEERQAKMPKPMSPLDKADIQFGSYIQGKDILAKAGREGANEADRQRIINDNAPELAKHLQSTGDPDYKDYATALGIARKTLEERTPKAPLADRPIVVRTGEEKLDSKSKEDLKENKKSADELASIMKDYNPSYANIGVTKGLGDLINNLGSKFSDNPEAAKWWRRLNSFFAIQRHKLFGASFTSGEAKIWNSIANDPSNSSVYIEDALNQTYNKLKHDQDINIEFASEGGAKRQFKSVEIAPVPMMGKSTVSSSATSSTPNTKDKSGFIVGKKYKDANGNIATYKGNGVFE